MTNDEFDQLEEQLQADYEIEQLKQGNEEPMRQYLQTLTKEELIEAVVEINKALLGDDNNGDLH